jgi:class 3 adenylate cyclase/predicted ATPase
LKCPRCQHENSTGVKFCGECGTRLELPCPSCRASNPPTNKFCNDCGAPLAQAATAEKFTSADSYTPKHLAEKILTSKSALEGERKQVTVLFADMKGSMELLADRDPEEARNILDPVLEHMMEAVHRYEGTVNQVMGDGIMGLFGAPLAHEDHAVKACYAALWMQESVKKYAASIQRAERIPIQIRIGMNSGEVVVRSIGSDLKMDYTAIGQTTHLAARMEQLATAGSILITPETLRLAESYVEVKPLGPVSVKGLSESVEVYEITGAGPVRSRLQAAAAARGLTQFVGRTAEFEILCQALERVEASHGQVVAVVGEPGVGKSRLLWQFTHSGRTANWVTLESGAVSYGKATPYLPLIDLLKAYFKVTDRDDEPEIRRKLTGKLLTLNRALEPTLPALLTLLDVAVQDEQWQNLDPSQRRQRILDAVKRLLFQESCVQPLALVLEDLQWIDSETQSFLDSLVESLPAARLLLLVNYRPEYQHGWGNKTYYSQLQLHPLAPAHASELLRALLGDDAQLQPLKQLVFERTEGNPFFLEECVRTLEETKFLIGERAGHRLARTFERTPLPATVQAVLAARIDRLPPEDKRLLQSASVIGKDVPFPLLQAIAEQPEQELRRGLTRLQASELLYETNLFPDPEYTFKHALTHEVAYGGLLQERRKTLHARIVETIENLFSERITEQAERLAHHALQGEVWEKALEYQHQAGKKAIARSANPQAVTYLEQALLALNHLPENRQTIKKALDIRVDLGPALIATNGFSAPQVKENYTRAHVLCDQFGETPQLFPVLWGLARMHDMKGELRVGAELGGQLLKLAQKAQDPELLLEAHHELWANLSALGELTTARLHVEQGFPLYDRQKHRQHAFLYGGHDPGVCCVFHAADLLWQLGYPDQALQKSRDSVIMARELTHWSTLSFALSFAAWFHQFRSDRQAVKAHVEEHIALATEHGFFAGRVHTEFLQGWLLAEEGNANAGITQMFENLVNQQTRRISLRFAHSAALLAEVLRKSGRTSEALNVVTEAIATSQRGGGRYYEAELHRIKGELLLAQSRRANEGAENCLIQAIKVASHQGAKALELRAAMSLSRLWYGQGEKGEARQLLGAIYGWFTEGFETADLKAAKALLEELSSN